MELSTYRLCRKHLIAAADRTATECIGSSRHGRCHHGRFRRRLLLGSLDHHLAVEHLSLFCQWRFLPLLCQRHPDKPMVVGKVDCKGRGNNKGTRTKDHSRSKGTSPSSKHRRQSPYHLLRPTRTASPLPFDSSLVVVLAVLGRRVGIPTYLSWGCVQISAHPCHSGPASPYSRTSRI